MIDLQQWLDELGLSRHATAFRNNGIGADVLCDLTDADLKELGLNLGDRKRLLKAIATLDPGRRRGMASPSEPTASSREAERRQLTVMFVDLVGSTALSARLDPEDMSEVLRAYQSAVAEAVTRFEGHVAKFMGDGVLAYFGWPVAHEDAAERAVRAGLAVTEAVIGIAAPTGEGLTARVGIATGLVVVGNLVGTGAAQEEAVVGETPNLAARLQGVAEPGAVVIGETTRRLLGGMFELEELGRQQLKGLARPVPSWRVMAARAVEGRFEALHGTSFAPLIGRERELALLLDRWRMAAGGQGQLVMVSGEPGIGKSRLGQTLQERVTAEACTILRYQCSPYHISSALHPIVEQFQRAAAFERDDPAGTKLEKLELLLTRSFENVAEVAPLFANLLAIPTGDRYPAAVLSPQLQKEKTLDALVAQLIGLATSRPALLLFEDAHWIDPTTQELLGRTIERVWRAPVLMIVTFRPEYTPPWIGDAHVTTLRLGRLNRREGETMIAELADNKPLPPEVVEQVAARTDGIPLFVEELTKAVLESGLLKDAGDRYELTGPLPALAIPETLHDSLLARLDRLAPTREVAQVGAAIGAEFSHILLAAVLSMGDGELRDALARLAESELIFCRGTPPQATYAFKHALVRDAAYESLLRSRRQQLHHKIATVIEEQFPETAPEVLAQHYTAARLVVEAVPYWLRAGQSALQRSDLTEAISHLTRGLDLLRDLPDDLARAQLEVGLHATLGLALSTARGYAVPEVELAYTRAQELCQRVGDAPRLIPVLYGICSFHLVRGNLRLARQFGEQIVSLAEQAADPVFLLMGHSALGHSLWHIGDNARAAAHLGRARAFYNRDAHAQLAIAYGQDFGVFTLGYLATARLLLGHPDEALRLAREGVALARRLNHPFSLCAALAFHLPHMVLRRDVANTLRYAEKCIAVAGEQRFPHWVAMATVYRGWALTQLGNPTEGDDQIRRGIAGWQAAGADLALAELQALLAESQLADQRPEEAIRATDEALISIENHGEGQWECHVRCVRGDALAMLNALDWASTEYRKALDAAYGQRAKWWELRAAVRLSRLWRAQGERAKAHDLLAPIYGWFTEGFDAPDLVEAKVLLEALA